MSEYKPSPRAWVAEQVERYERSGGTEALTLRDTGLPVIIVTNRGWKTGAIRKTPLMRVTDGRNYILVASQGGAPKHPDWYFNLRAHPEAIVELGPERFRVVARTAGGPERERLFAAQKARVPIRSESLPEKSLARLAVASATPSIAPSALAGRPSTIVMKAGSSA